jgi:hypothetical protein
MGTNLILKDHATQAEVHSAIASMNFVSEPVDALEGEHRQRWFARDRKSAVDFIDDSLTGVRYLWVRGREEESSAERLREKVPVWSRDDLLKHALDELVEGDSAKLKVIAMQVAADMTEYDIASGSVLTAFINMDEPSIRLAGARAMRAVPVAEFRLNAEKLSRDPDPTVAEAGKDLLNRIVELHGE